jgi:NADPH:quinone reductase-like Zn-dependent oxidoreductase
MKAYELHPKDEFESIVLAERPSPKLGSDDIRVRVRAVSLNYRDLLVARGAKSAGRAKPIIPTSDGAGEVIEVGANVTRFRAGDRVMASFFPTWERGQLEEVHHQHALGGGAADGMLATEVVFPQRAWVRVPQHLSFEEASTLSCAGVTAFNSLFIAAAVKPGDTVLLQGSGGVSVFALQLAKAAGARVIVTSSSDEKRERLKSLGAFATVDYKRNQTWGESVRNLNGGHGVDVAVEVGGPKTFDESVTALRFGGVLSLVGVLTGMRGDINTYAVFYKGITVRGIYVGSVEMLDALARSLEVNHIKPIIDRVFSFAEAKAAYAHLASGAHFGKVVIRVD